MRQEILNWKHESGNEIWLPFLELFKNTPVSDEEFRYLIKNSSENVGEHEKSHYGPTRKCLNSIHNNDKCVEEDLTKIDNDFLGGRGDFNYGRRNKINFKTFLDRVEKYPISQTTFDSLIASSNTTGDYDKYKQNVISISEIIMVIANKLHKQNKHIKQTFYFSDKEIQFNLDEQIIKSKKDNWNVRNNRLKEAIKIPEQIQITSVGFKRNPDVVAEVLLRANGICEQCNKNAPFIRKKDNTPYLEVHHKVMLSDDGEDTLENAIAICPNCHRELHFGI